MKTIVMYTGNDCSKCKAAKARFESLPPELKENVKFIEINVDETQFQRDYVVNHLKSNTLPTFELLPDGAGPADDGQIARGFEESLGMIMKFLGV